MQVLYVTNFEVAASIGHTSVDAQATCLKHLGAWIGRPIDSAVEPEELLRSGSRELSSTYGSLRRTAEWERVGDGDVWATRLERCDTTENSSDFITRVTIGQCAETTTLRVSMARDLRAGSLTPGAPPIVIQPGIVASLAADKSLLVRARGQAQDGQYIQVRTPIQVELLADALKSQDRLPVLLVHTRTLEAQNSVLRSAQRLIGLVRVVTLDYHAARLLRLALPGADVPYASGLLVWPNLSTQGAVIDSAVVNSSDPDLLRASLMSRVAPLSVLTGGEDTAYRTARRAKQQAEARMARARATEAIKNGSLKDELAAVEIERDRALEIADYNEKEWSAAQDAAEEYGKEVVELQARADHLQAQVEALTLSLTFAETGRAAPKNPDFDNAPTDLATGDVASLSRLCEHLEIAADGHIVFTPNVSSSWERAANYPTPSEMRNSLVKLAHVSAAIYSGEELAIGHLDTWVRENFDLRISLQDDEMPKKFRTFKLDGTSHDRTPHVKVNDGVPHWACGRVHFALDSLNSRLIVDHVGVHW